MSARGKRTLANWARQRAPKLSRARTAEGTVLPNSGVELNFRRSARQLGSFTQQPNFEDDASGLSDDHEDQGSSVGALDSLHILGGVVGVFIKGCALLQLGGRHRLKGLRAWQPTSCMSTGSYSCRNW